MNAAASWQWTNQCGSCQAWKPGVRRVTSRRVSSLTPSSPQESMNSPANRSAALPSAMHQGQKRPPTSWTVQKDAV
ncbi:hypothetical protein GCM10023257_70250 [Streptomyces hyderabadensis]|uniref:Uncharacterized protein n=1 Tax=Streptomyces hyderabadensis TaxID=598549 RepID=A0ABP9IY06_9ACTN